MIQFTTIRWKNFLSTGNVWTEVELNKSSTTLIVGDNGAGKSTFLDALCFVLFNQSFRNIRKGQLVNSINQKQLLVEVEFTSAKGKYLVRRGTHPNVFEIWHEGQMFKQNADIRDYQLILENQILGFSYTAFVQIVILGSAIFTPFMQLSTGSRREIIEDLLDIKIFSGMNRVLRGRLSQTVVDLNNLMGSLEVKKHKVQIRKSYIETLKHDKRDRIGVIEQRNLILEKDVTLLVETITKSKTSLDEVLAEIAKFGDWQNNREQAKIKRATLQVQLDDCTRQVKFYTENGLCPQCKQEITVGTKDKHLVELATKLSGIKSRLQIETEALQRFTEIEVMHDRLLSKASNYKTAIATNTLSKNQFLEKIKESKEERKGLLENTANIEGEKTLLAGEVAEILEGIAKRKELILQKKYLETAALLLKDDGIKTLVIKQYLPIINKLVNHYLRIMDLFVDFELDESFNEKILSRHRDDFTYASFSEGEKQRINLALLFAWRAIASMRNTVNIDLMVFDEILDGSLDTAAIDSFLDLIHEVGKNQNIFVISHKRDLFIDKFDRCLLAKKVNNYSMIEEVGK